MDQDKIKYHKVDLDKINQDQPFQRKDKEPPRFSISGFWNIFNKEFKINAKWRF